MEYLDLECEVRVKHLPNFTAMIRPEIADILEKQTRIHQLVENLVNENKALKQQISEAQPTTSAFSSEETDSLKTEIHELIHEIDACIEILNKA